VNQQQRQADREEALAHNQWVRANYAFELFVTGRKVAINRRRWWRRLRGKK